MGNAKRRGSLLERIAASQDRQITEAKRLEALRSEFAAEVQAQSARIGMALGTTNLMAQVPTVGAASADGEPTDHATPDAVLRQKTELRPARVVLVGLDDLLGRLGNMERAVDEACPEHGTNPACECVSCGIRKACGMLWKTQPVAEPAPPTLEDAVPGPVPFVEPLAAVPSASAVPALPDLSGCVQECGFDPATDGDELDEEVPPC
jgi:hypothetical protein